MKYVLSIDAGTTGITILLIDKDTKIIKKEYAELQQYHPHPSWVEHEPLELIEKTKHLIERITQNIDIKEISAIGITNQRETVVVWDKNTGKPIYNAIVWQCRRTSERCNELKKQGYEKCVKEKTGLVIDSYFSATKIEWVLKNKTTNSENLLCGTIDTWLVWNLTKKHVTDTSNASRTMLFNIHTKKWDDELLQLFKIPKNILPEVKSSSEIYGYTEINNVKIPLAGIAGDQQAALFGQCCFNKGNIKNTYGTGCFTLFNTGAMPVKSNNLLTTIAWTINNKTTYALEGSVFVAGAAVQWLRDNLNIITRAEETEAIANSIENNENVYFVPALTGLGCPYWDPNARGLIIGLTRATKKEHIVRAALESIAYQSRDVIKTMQKEASISVKELKADGGAAVNKFLMQFQADILNAKVIVPNITETTALGAAFLAGLAVNFWKDLEEIKSTLKVKEEYIPNMNEEIRNKLYNKWKEAVERSKNWMQ
ncbi:glycerol kinase [Candidatus Woesearchaeota archaeon CG10_big_fil_rev_8_21_14_0_10_34_8]|nr:MAG: glycerol kinase [Candidatus Woesearchaeota archaeon CG10_big_fil_rev_8_21_14_0_10_34_8]